MRYTKYTEVGAECPTVCSLLREQTSKIKLKLICKFRKDNSQFARVSYV